MKTIFMTTNAFEFGTLSATGTASGYDVNNILDRRPFTKWRAAADGTNYINIDHGGPAYGTSGCAIFGHNFHTVNAVVTLEYYDLGVTWRSAGTFNTTKNGATSLSFPVQAYGTQWRIKIVTSGSLIPEFAVAILSEITEFPMPPDSPHADFIEKGIKERGNSKTNNLLGVVNRGKTNDFNLKFTLLTRTWVDAYIRDWWWPSFGITGLPFAYIPDYNYDPEEVYLVRCSDDYAYQTPKSMGTYYDSIEFSLVGLRY